jgi:cell division protein FtsB
MSATGALKGDGYWKLNIQVLKNTQLRKQIKELIKEFLNISRSNKSIFTEYEQLKNQIRTILRDWSKTRARKMKEEISQLKKRIKT